MKFIYLNSYMDTVSIGSPCMYNELLLPGRTAKSCRGKAIAVWNLFLPLFSPFKRNAGILILTRHLAHVPLFTLHRVPLWIALVQRVGCGRCSGYVCRVSSEWRSLANRHYEILSVSHPLRQPFFFKSNVRTCLSPLFLFFFHLFSLLELNMEKRERDTCN